jgi:quercetin dioxygenase-like cupin family protein
MNDNAIMIKSGEEKSKTTKPGKLYRLMVKSDNLESIIAELDPHTESRWFQHGGEEFHLVLEGKLEYTVGDHTYKLNEGDILWHKSTLKHRATNTCDNKVIYITIGTPPTFSLSML